MTTRDTCSKEMKSDSSESINREPDLKHEEGVHHYHDDNVHKNLIKPEVLTATKYQLYARRWLMLAVVAVFNMSSGMIWISYAPIANFAADYYEVSLTAVNWFSLVFFLTFIPCGFFSFWIIDSLGLKSGVLCGTWLNALGALLRMAVSLIDLNAKTRFALALTGQVISGCAQPMALSMPTKLSAFWFGEKERTISNTISSLANPVGVLVANILSPLLVQHGSDIKVMVIVLAIPAVFAALLGTITFRSNKPPTPPSPSAEETSTPFKHVLLKAFQNKHYVVLMLTIGCGIAIFSAFSSIIFEAICPQGYSNLIAGIAGALLIVGGIVGSTITSLYVDRTKKFEDTIKIAALLISLSFSFLVVVTNMRNQSIAICIGCFFLGVFGLGALPVGLELGVEVTYPLAEATTSGLLWMTGQVVGVIILVILPYMGRDLTAAELRVSTCSTGAGASAGIGGAKDLSPVTMLMAVLTAAIVIIFTISFKADLRRLQMEFDRRVISDQID